MFGIPLRLGKLACHRGLQSVIDDGLILISVALLPLVLLIPLVALGLLHLLLLATISGQNCQWPASSASS
eukprot:15525927-Heterocapsa_arctica.AAC.1